MPLEIGNTIADLDESWPLGTDFVQEGDNHLRLIKSVLKAQFPGTLGQGYNEAIIATEAELNYLSGLTGNIQDQLDGITGDDSLIAPTGTVMIFYQVAPPLGWTQVLNNDNSMLRMVTSTGGGAGGTDDPISFDGVHTHTTDPHTLTIAEMPSHNHEYRKAVSSSSQTGSGNIFDSSSYTGFEDPNAIQTTGGGSPHAHGDTGEGGATFEPRYVNVIMATKD